MPGFRFDSDTDGDAVDQSTVAVRLSPDWNVDGRILNGGYLQAVVVRAAQRALAGGAAPALAPDAVPVAVSTAFAAPAVPGDARVFVTVLRAGGRILSASAALHQGAGVVASSLVTFGGPVVTDGYDAVPADAASYPAMPTVTGAADSIRIPTHLLPGPPGLAGLIDYGFVPENSAWLSGDTSAGPRIRCWLQFSDRRPMDVLAAVAFVDMAPPVCFATGDFGWAPTLQLQVGVFAHPVDGPMLLDLVGSPYDGRVVAEDGLLWDSAGTLIARSRQIALAPRR
jgi:hypothetical protein